MIKSCSCIINKNFNFVVEYKKDHILLIDKSEWQSPSYGTPLTTHDVLITSEGKTTKITYNIAGTTLINYSDLPSSAECSKDGIYTFTIDNCGKIYTKHEAIIPNTICAYSKYVLKTEDKNYKDNLWLLFSEIEYIKVNANLGLVDNAIKHFKLLEKLFKQLNCKC